jgi:hypothetical protein
VESEDGDAANGMINYWVYQAYLVFDQPIDSANGEGNIQQADRTSIKCKIPKNFQENGAIGVVAIAVVEDIIPDYEDNIDIWNEIKLDIYSGGYDDSTVGFTVPWGSQTAAGVPLVAAGIIGLGELVKIELANSGSKTFVSDYK